MARLLGLLHRHRVAAWVLVADSKGVNVWCAAGGDEFDTHAVVSAVKISGIAEHVSHRTLILPPLGAPGIRAREVEEQTGWKARWGPVRYHDLPAYLADRQRRSEAMKRVTYDWRERLDTALGSVSLAYLLGALGFLIFGRSLLPAFLAVGAITFVSFFLVAPWLPTRRGIVKTLSAEVPFAAALAASYLDPGAVLAPWRGELIIALVMIFVYGMELGGVASVCKSDLDPLMARLGIGAMGNVAWAGTVRTELLNGYRTLTYDASTCVRCRSCVEICPQGVWTVGDDKRIRLSAPDLCTACRACLEQCPTDSIRAPKTPRGH